MTMKDVKGGLPNVIVARCYSCEENEVLVARVRIRVTRYSRIHLCERCLAGALEEVQQMRAKPV